MPYILGMDDNAGRFELRTADNTADLSLTWEEMAGMRSARVFEAYCELVQQLRAARTQEAA